jgi:PAS domain S-box-containing protein
MEIDDAHFRFVADSTCDWESWHGVDGKLLWVNPAVAQHTGYSIEECHAITDYPLPIVAKKDRRRIEQIYQSAQEGSSGNDVEFTIIHRNGETRSMAVSWQPMFDASHRNLGFRTSIRDVTERRKMRDRLRMHAEQLEQLVQERTARIQYLERHRQKIEKQAALGQLAAAVAHEINNPLAGMRNAFELFKPGVPTSHRHYELLGLIDREIEHIASIVHQMYQLYRRYPQTPTAFSLTQTVREVLCLIERVAGKKRVSLKLQAADGPPVTLPEGDVKQVLYNLVCNAIQASPEGAEVTVRLKQSDEEVAVSVEDHGHGIRDDVLPSIFDPFFSTRDGQSQMGMGLGLSVSRSIVETLGGRIDVQTQVGRGSVFTAVFPRSLDISPLNDGDYET